MIGLGGRVLGGLDEFMLRLGHLKVLCNISSEQRASGYRTFKNAASLLTRESEVPKEKETEIGDYLLRKKLCRIVGANDNQAETHHKYRYPGIGVEPGSSNSRRLVNLGHIGERPKIWWQDLCLADSEINSKVGAVTVKSKGSGKTGLSHIFDWAEILGLISSGSQPSVVATLLVKLGKSTKGDDWVTNPYILGPEKLFLAHQIITADIDVFSRLIPKIGAFPGKISKKDAVGLYTDSIKELASDAETAGYLTTRMRQDTFRPLKELERAMSRKQGDLARSSTAWHRTASRFESYVDLGFLKKGGGGESERYSYVYYSCPNIEQLVTGLNNSDSVEDWVDSCLVEAVLGPSTRTGPVPALELIPILRHIIEVIRSPVPNLPIDPIAAAVVVELYRQGVTINFGSARESIIELARQKPEVARLARGYSGDRAEFVSLDYRRLQ